MGLYRHQPSHGFHLHKPPLKERTQYLKVNTLFAQQGFLIGIEGGSQNTWLYNKSGYPDNIKHHFSLGYSIGNTWGYNFSKRFGVMTGIYYSNQTSKYYITNGYCLLPVKSDFIIKRRYIQFPLLLKGTIFIKPRWNLQLAVGAQYAALLSVEDNFDDLFACLILTTRTAIIPP